ncbi:proline iminopeptidase-family hydrolase [Actinocatenispora rupis]|uniref:Proline iminopeptidase n=2 Tax=Actinocatenispora rupis TaxID=519421 RepID=A0A8J3IUI5_9ACTN|nr:proline iminopeptidase [Actinocatenispora rupis]
MQLGGWQTCAMFGEGVVRVCADPVVDLFVAETAGPAERTVLVVHGGPDWDGSYLRQPLVELGGECRVVLPDLRGCGRSTRGLADEQYSWDLVVADLLALLDARQVKTVDVVGFSTGGKIAQRVALAAPERVRRLVVASSNVVPVPPDAFDGWQERDRRHEAGARLANAEGVAGVELTRAWAWSSAPANVWRPDKLDEYLHRLEGVAFSGEWMRPYQAGLLSTVLPDDAVDRLAALGIPILLLHGRQDMTFPAALAEQAAKHIPSARAVVLEQAGHMAHIDQPDQWIAAVREFLA